MSICNFLRSNMRGLHNTIGFKSSSAFKNGMNVVVKATAACTTCASTRSNLNAQCTDPGSSTNSPKAGGPDFCKSRRTSAVPLAAPQNKIYHKVARASQHIALHYYVQRIALSLQP